jgi:hypothetical protein
VFQLDRPGASERSDSSLSIMQLSVSIEILEKPISNKMLIDTVEDKAIYEELRKLKIDIEPFKLSHELLKKILDILKKRAS